jgi:hypothetical protein
MLHGSSVDSLQGLQDMQGESVGEGEGGREDTDYNLIITCSRYVEIY